MRPTYSKLVTLAFLFVAAIMAEREGYLAIGRPGDTAVEAENPVAVVILALLVRAVTQGARMGLFPPMTVGLLHRIMSTGQESAFGPLVRSLPTPTRPLLARGGRA
jgi:hypothetical protein